MNTLQRDRLGWILAVLALLSAVNSTFFFLKMMKSGIDGWLMMNSCAPSILIFFTGFILRSPAAAVAGSVWMLRYGTAGLFVFGWTGPNLAAQAGHLLMTAAAAWTLAECIRHRRWKSLGIGLAVGVFSLAPFMAAQGAWFKAHPGLLQRLFEGRYSSPSP
jgi:hypothetical protein